MVVGVHARVLNLLADAQQPGELQDAEGGAAQPRGPQADHEDQNPGTGSALGIFGLGKFVVFPCVICQISLFFLVVNNQRMSSFSSSQVGSTRPNLAIRQPKSSDCW